MTSGASPTSKIVAVALPLLLASTIAQAGHKLEREDRKKVDVSGQTVIVIKNTRGKTIVVGEQGSKQVNIVANKWVGAKDAESAQRIMDALVFEVEVSDDKMQLRSALASNQDPADLRIDCIQNQGALHLLLAHDCRKRKDI